MNRTIDGLNYAIVIPFHLLERVSLARLHKDSKPMKELNGAMKLLVNAQNDNSRFKLELDGHYFSVHISQFREDLTQKYSIYIWDIRGSLSLYTEQIQVTKIKPDGYEIPVMANEQWREIKDTLRRWIRNKEVNCSTCGKPHKKLGQFWFAATYCDDCWPKIKNKALSETYE